jgi:excisionase family DNA binding protein
MNESQPLFMRLPAAAAEQLDVLARNRGQSKREVVTHLILDKDLTVGQHHFRPSPEPAVLTPDQAAELLQIDGHLIVELAAAGQLPGRRLGDQWRFSREGLLRWLESIEHVDKPQ